MSRDSNETIKGEIMISLIETKGLILPKEVNRKQMDKKAKFNPCVEVGLYNNQGEQLRSYTTEPAQNVREMKWGNAKDSTHSEFTKNLGEVHHSGQEENDDNFIQI